MGMREDKQIEALTENWVSINKFEDKVAWLAWTNWRRSQMRCHQEPENLTVPTPFPPSTIGAAKEYVASVKIIRGAIGWKDTRSGLSTDVSAWMGQA